MTNTNEFLWVYVTAPSKSDARKIAQTCVAERLAGCANILGEMESTFWWEGHLENSSEWALVLKTTHSKMDSLKSRILELHPYELPCVIALPLVPGSHTPYLEWIDENLRGGL